MAIKFCCKVNFLATKTVELIQKAYGDAALSRTTIFEWHKRFQEGRESVKDDKGSGLPTTSRTGDKIAANKMVKEDRKVTSWLIAHTLGIPKTVVLWILREDLNKRKLCSRCVPQPLTREQMDERVAARQDLLNMITVTRTFWTRLLQVTIVAVLRTIPKQSVKMVWRIFSTTKETALPKVKSEDDADSVF